MSTSVVSVRLDADVKRRLDALSAATGRSVAYYVREALEQRLDELEYAYQLRAEAEAIRKGELGTIPSAALSDELFS